MSLLQNIYVKKRQEFRIFIDNRPSPFNYETVIIRHDLCIEYNEQGVPIYEKASSQPNQHL